MKETDPKLEDRETRLVKTLRWLCLILMDTPILILIVAISGLLFVSWNITDGYNLLNPLNVSEHYL